MILELFIGLLLMATAYLRVLNKRVDALPANTRHEQEWLKDPKPIKEHVVHKE